ncbi:alpha/beta hydrolase [Sphingomonas naphthae]|uniref:Alpha/beta hydrolase n=1 Tax=Sphingomonas naphthae TaxID=1813468 RepID=A0ABY7TNT6_9SPHN|nr:alpha/beta hydrolase [Sphingomonas naphthae]WCT74728.1 alpha/beta hydrolase [Sphingomonas naphthae]
MPDESPAPFIREDVAKFLAFLKMMNTPGSHELGAIEGRKAMRANASLADRPVGELAVLRDISIPRAGGPAIPARLFDRRDNRLPGPAVMFTHGGGWVVGDLDTHASLCAEIARTLDLPVIAIDYRLAPENPWPAAPDDCEAAARWIATSPADLGLAITGLVLMGDSAGGTLAVTTAMALRDAPAAMPVLVQAPLYPAIDHGPDYASYATFADGYFLSDAGMRWFQQCYQPDLTHWRGAPIRGDQTGMPPTLVLTASLDPLRDQGRAYAAATIAAGVPTVYREARGTIHAHLSLRNALPSAVGDLGGLLATLKPMIVEAEAARVLAAASGEPA